VRFLDSAPEFLYVPADRVMAEAQRVSATPYDVPGVELGHHGEQCSFDAFIAQYGLRDVALDKLATIVCAADCGRPHDAPGAAGLLAIARGLSLNFTGDHEMLAHGMVPYDALYAQCAGAPVAEVLRPLTA